MRNTVWNVVSAKTCEACKSHLTIAYQERGAAAPLADGLATLALDILFDEAGNACGGPNQRLAAGPECRRR